MVLPQLTQSGRGAFLLCDLQKHATGAILTDTRLEARSATSALASRGGGEAADPLSCNGGVILTTSIGKEGIVAKLEGGGVEVTYTYTGEL